MVSLPVYDTSGSEVGKYEIDPSEIAPNINKQLLHDVVVMYQASARQGSHKSKSRGEVAGANKKMYRQKGTGNARAGSTAKWYSTGWWTHFCQETSRLQLPFEQESHSGRDSYGDCWQDSGRAGRGCRRLVVR